MKPTKKTLAAEPPAVSDLLLEIERTKDERLRIELVKWDEHDGRAPVVSFVHLRHKPSGDWKVVNRFSLRMNECERVAEVLGKMGRANAVPGRW
jgi:hypothetical protein